MNDCHKSLNINNLRRPGPRKSLITKGLQKKSALHHRERIN